MEPQEPKLFSKRNIISLLVLFVLGTGVFGGIAIRNNATQLKSRASTEACPVDNWQNVSNEALIGNCSIEQLAQIPNSRLEEFPFGTLEQFSNDRLDDFSLEFLIRFRNERLLLFSNDFLLNFSNDRLDDLPVDRLKTFPPERIDTFSCDLRAQLGRPCQQGTQSNPPAQTPAAGCPISDWQNKSNEELISKCNHVELAQLPNHRLEGFPNNVLELFPNDRLDDLSLGFLAGLRNERLLLFSNDFLIKFPNDRLDDLPVDRLKTFPPDKIDSFSCELRAKLGRPCQQGTQSNPSAAGCPISDWQNKSNEELISKCSHAELAQLPNSRLEGFPKDVLELFSNDRLDDFDLGFLEGFRNERLLLFSNDFLIKFRNERLEKLPVDRLKTFPPDKIDSFSCELRAKLGRPCQQGGVTPTFNASSCEGIKITKGSDVYVDTASNPPAYRILEVGQDYNVAITLKNVDKNNSSYTPATWSKGNPGQDKKYFLGFPTEGDSNTTPGAVFKTNINTSDLSANTQWSISWPDSTKLRLPLNKNSVGPNDSETFQFTIKPLRSSATSPNGGKHTFYWSLIQEGVEWFGAECGIDIDVDSGALGASPAPSATPSIAPVVGTQCVAVSTTDIPENVKCDMATLPVEGGLRIFDYKEHPLKNINFGFGASAPGGVKTIHVRFIATTGQVSPEFIKNILYQPPATISSATCTYSPDGTGTVVTIEGVGFGDAQGQSKITAGGKLIESTPISWADKKVQIKSPDKLVGSVPIKITTPDNKSSEKNCQVNVSSVDFTVKIQCRTSDKASGDELNVKVYEIGASSTEPQQRVKSKIDAQGKPQNLQAKFEANKSYIMVVKAPGTLAKKVPVPVGSRIIDAPVILPIGDIGGNNNDIQDGIVNSLDSALLKKQWSSGVDVTNRSADVNKDKRVNSIDYACIGSNNGGLDEKFDPTIDTAGPSDGIVSNNTTITLVVNKQNPTMAERIIFSGSLKDSKNNILSGKVVKLVESATGAVLRSSDQTADGVTHNTDANGNFAIAINVSSENQFSVYAKFDGDSSSNSSQSTAVTISPVAFQLDNSK